MRSGRLMVCEINHISNIVKLGEANQKNVTLALKLWANKQKQKANHVYDVWNHSGFVHH